MFFRTRQTRAGVGLGWNCTKTCPTIWTTLRMAMPPYTRLSLSPSCFRKCIPRSPSKRHLVFQTDTVSAGRVLCVCVSAASGPHSSRAASAFARAPCLYSGEAIIFTTITPCILLGDDDSSTATVIRLTSPLVTRSRIDLVFDRVVRTATSWLLGVLTRLGSQIDARLSGPQARGKRYR